MTDDRIRERLRRGLSSLLEHTSDGPSWEELEAAAQAPRPVRRLIPAAGVGAALAILVVSLVFVNDGGPQAPSDGPPPFDADQGALVGRAWWSAVIEGDLDRAMTIAHPNAAFNYPGLRDLVFSLGLESISIELETFGIEALPQLCFEVTGPHLGLSGSLVFREFEASWLLWEMRTNVEGCVATSVTTTTPAVALVTELPLDQRIPITILAVRPNYPSLAMLDFESGTITRYPPGAHALPLDALGGAVATSSGDMIIWTNGVARLFYDDLTTVISVLGPHSLREIPGIAPGVRVVPAPDGGSAWLVQPGIGYGSRNDPTLVELVDLPSGRLLDTFELDPDTFPVGATSSGLVLNLESLVFSGDGWVSDGDPRVIHLNRDGSVLDLGPGHAIAATTDRVLKLLEDSTRLVVVGLDGQEDDLAQPVPGRWMDVGGPGIPSEAMPLQTVSPDQLRLLIAIGDSVEVNGPTLHSTLFTLDLDTGDATVVLDVEGPPPLATWSRDGQWILTTVSDGSVIELRQVDDLSYVYTLLGGVPEEHWVLAAG